MAHKIQFTNGKANFASKKEMPWHGLGTIVETMTSKEAIVLGGLDFTVEKRPSKYDGGKVISFEDAKDMENIVRIKRKVFYDNTEGVRVFKYINEYKESFTHPDNYSTVRTDNDFPLGKVGEKYEVIQNSEAFEFFDSVVGEHYADYETVGALGQGETIFITAKLKEEMVVNKDLIDKYLLLTMSHDGSSAIMVMFTPVRVVCNNTLSLALQGKNKVVIKHTRHALHRLELSKKVLGIVDIQTQVYNEVFGNMFKTPISDSYALNIMEKSMSMVRDDKKQLSTRSNNVLNQMNGYYHEGLGQEGLVGTAWGVFNGITGYLQNVRDYKDNNVKFKNMFLATNVDIREKAFHLLTN